jgi:hypothetical protein
MEVELRMKERRRAARLPANDADLDTRENTLRQQLKEVSRRLEQLTIGLTSGESYRAGDLKRRDPLDRS